MPLLWITGNRALGYISRHHSLAHPLRPHLLPHRRVWGSDALDLEHLEGLVVSD